VCATAPDHEYDISINERIKAMKRELYSSGAIWEPIVGYSRAVKFGNQIWVSGTTSTDSNGEIVGKGDAAAQTRQIIANITSALAAAGAHLSDVVRTRIFVTDMSQWEVIGRAHGEAFRDIRPAATMVEVRRLIDPDLLVEIEVEAILGSGDAR
jgi:enamine deaminase RidA (YjgF/YER057c/UK114 family)